MKNEIIERDKFIIAKSRKFTPLEIEVLLPGQGFEKIGRSTIYQILRRHGITPKKNYPTKGRRNMV
jgi:transposase